MAERVIVTGVERVSGWYWGASCSCGWLSIGVLGKGAARILESQHSHDHRVWAATFALPIKTNGIAAGFALDGEPSCGDVDPEEGACILVLDHDGRHWHSMFGTPRA